MSVFPKRVHYGDNVIIHLAFGLKFLVEGLYTVVLDILIKDPSGESRLLHSKTFPFLKVSDTDEQQFAQSNATSKYKYTPLHLLGRYFHSDQSVTNITAMLNAIPSGKHFYFNYKIPFDSLPGKYEVDIVYYINGEVFYSKNRNQDFFYVEDLCVKEVPEGILLLNKSNEDCPFKMIAFTNSGTIKECYTAVLKGSETRHYPLNTKAFIQYNEDRLVIPLTGTLDKRPVQNPRLASSHKFKDSKQAVVIFLENKKDAYELEEEYLTVWTNCDGLKSKTEVLNKVNKAVYEEMLQEQLIIELD